MLKFNLAEIVSEQDRNLIEILLCFLFLPIGIEENYMFFFFLRVVLTLVPERFLYFFDNNTFNSQIWISFPITILKDCN